MEQHHYVIVGGGMAAAAAVGGIRKIDTERRITVIAAEKHPPYKRPPLSKALWKGEQPENIWLETPADGVQIRLSRTVRRIDPVRRTVEDDAGEVYSYAKLLLATGGEVRRLPVGGEEVVYFRTFDDYQRLRAAAAQGASIVVIGGGFIGSEIAASLCMQGVQVTMIFPEESIGARAYPAALSRFLNDYYREHGISVLAGETVSRIERDGNACTVVTSQGRNLAAVIVVAGVGIAPNVALAQQTGLRVTNGIEVNELLQTSDPSIFAAGDAANFFNPHLGKRIRVEHEDNATAMGEQAGKNMAGEKTPYHHLPFFYSDLFDLGYEAVGELDARYETVEQWKEQLKEGIVYYLENSRVRGVLLWNTWGQVEAARKLIAEKGPFSAGTVRGRLPA